LIERASRLVPKVALIGAGAMGAALLKGWLEKHAIDAAGSAVFDPQIKAPAERLARDAGLALNPEIGPGFDVAVLAIKPQMLGEAARYGALARGALVVSVIAGKSVASISSVLGTMRIVRAMPNLASMAGAGAAGLFAPAMVTSADREAARALLEAVGAAVFVDSEAAIDAVTAISGSGPAYFFLMAEALEDAARALGLPDETAKALARQTLIGAGAVVEMDARSAGELRKAVTSPGGTTGAALEILDGESELLRRLMKEAAGAAFARARELSA
jgi:pyrroline-5-carboxylate reductase